MPISTRVVIFNNAQHPEPLREVEQAVEAARQDNPTAEIIVLSPSMPLSPVEYYFPATGRGFEELESFLKNTTQVGDTTRGVVLGIRRVDLSFVQKEPCSPLVDGVCIAFSDIETLWNELPRVQSGLGLGAQILAQAPAVLTELEGPSEDVRWDRPYDLNNPLMRMTLYARAMLKQTGASSPEKAFQLLFMLKTLDVGDWLSTFSADEEMRIQATQLMAFIQIELSDLKSSGGGSLTLPGLFPDASGHEHELEVTFSQAELETVLDDARKAVWLYVEQTGDISSVLTASAILQIDPTTNPADEKLKHKLTSRTLKQMIADLSGGTAERRFDALRCFQQLAPEDISSLKKEDVYDHFDFDVRAQEMLKTDPSGDVIWLSFLSLVRQHPKQKRELTHKLLDRLVWSSDPKVQATHAELCEHLKIADWMEDVIIDGGSNIIPLLTAQMTNGDRSVESRVGLLVAILHIGGPNAYLDALASLVREIVREQNNPVHDQSFFAGCGTPKETTSAQAVFDALLIQRFYNDDVQDALIHEMGSSDPDLKAFLVMRSSQTL